MGTLIVAEVPLLEGPAGASIEDVANKPAEGAIGGVIDGPNGDESTEGADGE
jgi:hypothetical protein